MTILKLFAWLPHCICLSGFTLVAMLGIITAEACVAIGNLLPMSPTIIVWVMVAISLPIFLCSLLFKNGLGILQLVGAVFKLLGQARV
jgi:hypothetical protein